MYTMYLQCFDIVGWVTWRSYPAWKKHVPLISKSSVLEQVEEENHGRTR